MVTTIAIILAFVAVTYAGPHRPYEPAELGHQCQNLTIPISIASRNGIFNLETPQTNIDVTNFILEQSRQGHNLSEELLKGYSTVSGNYSIGATLCNPAGGLSSSVQILTHGIGFDRSYWDFSYANYNYSYVSEALAKGYSTFSWDRLGTGESSFGEPINEIQGPLEIAALHELTRMLKHGDIPGLSHAKYSQAIHVGHSFGSAITYTLALMYPEDSDGIVLTGFSQNSTAAPSFLQGSNFILTKSVDALRQFPLGYFAATSTVGVQIDFFAPGQFDSGVLDFAFATGQPVTPGELLTLSGQTTAISGFVKPVLIITGEHDTPYCGGDCYSPSDPAVASIPAASSYFLPNANPLQITIVPKAGHGLNLEYSHPFTYTTIFEFLTSSGLFP